VIDYTSLYNCIIGRTGLAQLGAACSTAHLKLKYHADNSTITTLHGDIEAAQRCFLQANKHQNSVSLLEQSFMDEGKTDANTLDSNLIELDPRFTKLERKQLKKEKKEPLNMEILRPIPDGHFELIPFGDDPAKCFKLGKGIPVDFISFTHHDCDLTSYLKYQDLNGYFNMLNGLSYKNLVRYFWVRAKIYEKYAARMEEHEKV
jgi:hypothetical protein